MSEVAVISGQGVSEGVPASIGAVLIIDDEVEIRESLQTLLELEGYEVHCAEKRDWRDWASGNSILCCSIWLCRIATVSIC